MKLSIAYSYSDLNQFTKTRLLGENIFYAQDYQDYIASTGKKLIYLYSSEYIIAVVIAKILLFKFAYFPSESVKLKKETDNNEGLFLSTCIRELNRIMKLDWIAPNQATSIFKTAPETSIKIPFGSYVIDLRTDINNIWNNIHGKHKNSIRRAEKNGVKVVHGGAELLRDYMSMEEATYNRSNKKGNDAGVYQKILDLLKHNSKLFISYKDDVPQSGALLLYNSAYCYYLYGNSSNDIEPGANNLLQWHAIEYMHGIGVSKYSFVGARINVDKGSKYDGIQRFKERFGGELVQGYMFKEIFNKFKYNLWCRLLYFKKNKGKKYHIDIIDQELHKW